MEFPGWVRTERVAKREGKLWVTLHFRAWHPGFWLFLWRNVEAPVWFKVLAIPTVVLRQTFGGRSR